MRTVTTLASLLLASAFPIAGCISPVPHDRVQAYLGPATDLSKPTGAEDTVVPADGFQTALLVLNDTSGPESAPGMSEPIFSQFNVIAREQLERGFPLQVSAVIPADGVVPEGDSQKVGRMGTDNNVDHVMLVIFSSEETEFPAYFGFGPTQEGGGGGGSGVGGRPSIPGFRVQNYALVEMALLDANSGNLIVGANGRAWAVLERLDPPVESNNYPVVRRALTNPPIFPEEDVAYDTLRGIAADDALKQALMRFEMAWKDRFPEKKVAR